MNPLAIIRSQNSDNKIKNSFVEFFAAIKLYAIGSKSKAVPSKELLVGRALVPAIRANVQER
jgi:hypothetical protein